jgi:hypothetical protein
VADGADASKTQDEYRVIVFDDQELSSVNFKLPTHARPPANFQSSKAESYLRNHFKRCLHVHFCGGDIHQQYGQGQILSLMCVLGIGYDSEDIPVASSDDPRWDSELGRVLQQAHFEGEMATRLWKPRDEDGNSIHESSNDGAESGGSSP